MKQAFVAAILSVGLPLAAHAQSGEIFIPGADNGAEVQVKPKPQSALARCLANPNAANCADVGGDDGGLAFESAGAIEYETLVLDLDEKKVTVSKAPPPAPPSYDAPQTPAHGTVAYPSVAITIEFDYDSDQIRGDQITKIMNLVNALNDPALQGTTYAVIGHTDSVGSFGYNCDLSLRRAASVTRTLEGANVYVPLYPVGFGEHVLKDTHNPRSAVNRRVTFMRLPDNPGAVLQTANAVCRS
ncbi:OmpA family protein [Tropicibacter naphthalenivorans]|uniref:Outer membrane porin F n=1 Tax=Tropicibacter naphthalenivorans TaxID=441103 RepID=A0A0P1G0R7_9RHOB|nr:OmpA family protein [Tropicibacter naphthalenivorans]CUH75271.1 Outer membrane porin F precursor [Tropicibacter naphthalenivorans]